MSKKKDFDYEHDYEDLCEKVTKMEEEFKQITEITNIKLNNSNEKINQKERQIDKKNQVIKSVTVILCLSLLLNAFVIWKYFDTTTETVTNNTDDYDVEQNTHENSKINNVKGNQYNDNAIHNDTKENKGE